MRILKSIPKSILNKQVYGSYRFYSNSAETFVNSSSSSYIQEMYQEFLRNPEGVHLSWRVYFRNMDNGRQEGFQAPPSLIPRLGVEGSLPLAGGVSGEILDTMKVQLMVR